MADDATAVAAPPTPPAADANLNAEPPKGHEEAFGALDALGRDEGTPEPPATPPPGDGRVRGADGKFVPKDKVVEKSKPVAGDPSKVDDIDPTKLKTSELAKHYHALKAKEKEWVKKKEEYETKLKAPQEWPEKKTYEEKLAEREKAIEEHKQRVAKYETELQFTNFTKSQAYQDNFLKPYNEAWLAGQKRAESLKVVERKDEAENVLQPARKATAADFDSIMSIFDDDLAAEKAAEMFGPAKAPLVLYHREQVIEKQNKANAAVKEYQEKGQVWEKQQREASEKRSREVSGAIENFRNAAIEKYPQYFKPDPADPEGNKYLEKGQHLLDRVIKGGAPLKDGEQQMTDEEMAIAVAAVRNKAAGFDRVAYLASTRGKRIKELEKKLAEFETSKPANGNGNGRTSSEGEKDALQMIYDMGKER